ncbi:MAG: CHAT domain-containing protein [Acidobacteriota bacterium]
MVERWQVEDEGQVLWQGRLGTYADWRYLIDEIVPRLRPVQIFGQRPDGSRWQVILGTEPEPADLEVRPLLDETAVELYREGQEAFDLDRRDEALDRWRALFDAAFLRGDPAVALWIGLRIAARGDPRHDDALVRSVLARLGSDVRGRRERSIVLEAEILWETRQRNFAVTEPLLHEAVEQRRATGDPIHQARSLYELGVVKVRSGDPVQAQPFYSRALELQRLHALGGLAEARTQIGLGYTNALLGNLGAAEEHWVRSLELHEALAPASRDRIGVLYNLGSIAGMAGDQKRSERYLLEALELDTEQGDGALRGGVLNNLGELALRRGDLDRAQEHFTASLAIKRKRIPDDVSVASTLTNLGNMALIQEDVDRAEHWFGEALDQVRRSQPGGILEASALEMASRASLARGDHDRAADQLARAQEIIERTAPDGQLAVAVDRSLAELAVATGDLAAAAGHYRRATTRLESVAPSGDRLVQVLAKVAELHGLQGEVSEAIAAFGRALDLLESHVQHVGGAPNQRDLFRAKYHSIYRRQIELLAGAGRAVEAFAVLERSRAQGLLELLAGRDLRLDEAPPELERRRRDLAARYSRGIHRLATQTGAEDRQDALAELADLRRQRDAVIEALWREAPQVAGLRHPRPLDAETARASLDPGTLLLSWSVGQEQSVVFALGRSKPVEVAVLPIGEEDLARRVDRFVDLIRDPRSATGDEIAVVARRLGDELLGPVAGAIEDAERLLLSPDGPLHRLPFAALRLAQGGGERWLVEALSMARTPSMTVLAELHRLRRNAGAPESGLRLAAFGATKLPSSATQGGDRTRQALFGDVSSLAPLPASAHEVEAVVGLFPGGEAFLGERATEWRVKSVAAAMDILHFATHALIDEEAPLESALVLSLPEVVEPGDEDGLLQVWEIFEDLRLHAELVVLSACGTALGKPVPGEGLLGLERAFHFAGARSVLASLWPVSDVATSRLMERFYRHLQGGLPRDEALRKAQLETISDGAGGAAGVDPSAPVHWAAFRLSGDVAPLQRPTR